MTRLPSVVSWHLQFVTCHLVISLRTQLTHPVFADDVRRRNREPLGSWKRRLSSARKSSSCTNEKAVPSMTSGCSDSRFSRKTATHLSNSNVHLPWVLFEPANA